MRIRNVLSRGRNLRGVLRLVQAWQQWAGFAITMGNGRAAAAHREREDAAEEGELAVVQAGAAVQPTLLHRTTAKKATRVGIPIPQGAHPASRPSSPSTPPSGSGSRRAASTSSSRQTWGQG